jgi:hypothetical protein
MRSPPNLARGPVPADSAFWAGVVICSPVIRGGARLHHEAGQPEPLDEIVIGVI